MLELLVALLLCFYQRSIVIICEITISEDRRSACARTPLALNRVVRIFFFASICIEFFSFYYFFFRQIFIEFIHSHSFAHLSSTCPSIRQNNNRVSNCNIHDTTYSLLRPPIVVYISCRIVDFTVEKPLTSPPLLSPSVRILGCRKMAI